MKFRLALDQPTYELQGDSAALTTYVLNAHPGTEEPAWGFILVDTVRKLDGWERVIEVRSERGAPALAYIDKIPEDDVLQGSDEGQVLCEMIGDYSQNYLECSYNEDDILQELLAGTLDKNIQFRIDRQIILHFEEKMGDLYRADGTYAAQLFDAVIAAGGWAREYSARVVPMDQIPGLSEACAKYLSEKSQP